MKRASAAVFPIEQDVLTLPFLLLFQAQGSPREPHSQGEDGERFRARAESDTEKGFAPVGNSGELAPPAYLRAPLSERETDQGPFFLPLRRTRSF